jgi:hypothetical protein
LNSDFLIRGVVILKPILGVDIETYSPVPLPKTGVYRYVDTDEFQILLFSYAYDDGPVYTVDMACGERLPEKVRIHIHCAKPGLIIGRGGAEIDKLRANIEKRIGKSAAINIIEIKNMDLSAQLVA